MDTSIKNWVTPDPAVADAGTSLVTAVQKMAEKKIGAILITREGRLQGIFTERDLLRLFSGASRQAFREHLENPVGNFMTAEPICAQASDDYNTVYMKMKSHNVRHIPVLEGERLVGIVSMRDLIHFYQNKLETEFNDARHEIENLKKLVTVSNAEKVDILIKEIQRYKELSLTDYLTGLFNKRYFLARLSEEVTRAKRSPSALSLIFCDIDFFKRVNDRFGHQGGDEVLQQIARLLRSVVSEFNIISRLRKSDIVARYGGEEFVIILPETDRRGAAIAAERLRQTVADFPFCLNGEEFHLTMSFGVAELAPEDQDQAEIIKNADYAMYKAKNSGRNRVAVYPAEEESD